MAEKSTQQGLKRVMKSRHLFMIALGGVIGAGFFNASGFTISQSGPVGAVLAYMLGGLIMYLVMLCLGELTVAMPVAGSFQTYTAKYIHPSTGFTVGWIYWIGWSSTVAYEIVSIGFLMQRWFPGISPWLWSLIAGILLFSVNALSARSFAETEFWFASIKVITIVLFILIGGAAIFGFVPIKGETTGPLFKHLTEFGFFPHGVLAVIVAMMAVNYSLGGTELVGIAAGESESPEKTIPKAINQTAYRIILFFVLSMIIVVSIVPWKEIKPDASPFVSAMDMIGVPYAADIMNFVIITSLLSVANSGLYTTTRMLYSLSNSKMAPKSFQKLSKKGVPLLALCTSMGISCISIIVSKVAAETIYTWILSVAGMASMLAWMSIAASQYFFRKRYIAEGGKVSSLGFRTPLYPLVPILAFSFNLIVLISLAFDEGTKMTVYIGVPVAIAFHLIYLIFVQKKKENNMGISESKVQ
ncbi:amino acid permease [Bacillus sp. MUM 116]|uniref:amino acid permease n=1 Tax=Bacillus sp. MUM 116 TaxID=1678002 RepID=UPI0008F5F072|nr:amino acid permease [Bacillus sp. MUM 116]OIK08878.1 amino acid permease [Bacillus sp. MUM 116]